MSHTDSADMLKLKCLIFTCDFSYQPYTGSFQYGEFGAVRDYPIKG